MRGALVKSRPRPAHGAGFVDRYTLAHGAVGVLMGAMRFPFWAAAGTAVGWEAIERPLKDRLPDLFPYNSQDSWKNVVGDVAGMMAGYGLWRLLVYLANRKG